LDLPEREWGRRRPSREKEGREQWVNGPENKRDDPGRLASLCQEVAILFVAAGGGSRKSD